MFGLITNKEEFECLESLYEAEDKTSGRSKEHIEELQTLRKALDEVSRATTPPQSVVSFPSANSLFEHERPGNSVILSLEDPRRHTNHLDACDKEKVPDPTCD